MNTLPPLPRFLGSLTLSVEPPLMSTGPNLLTIRAGVLPGSTGTSPVPAALVTWIVPAGAESVAPLLIETGPPTKASVPGTGPRVLPLTVIAAGLAVKKPNAAGGAALSVLASGLVA